MSIMEYKISSYKLVNNTNDLLAIFESDEESANVIINSWMLLSAIGVTPEDLVYYWELKDPEKLANLYETISLNAAGLAQENRDEAKEAKAE